MKNNSSFDKVKHMVVNAMVEVYKTRNKEDKVVYKEVRERFEVMFNSKLGRKRIIELANYYKRNTKNPATKQIMENVEVLTLIVDKK